MLVSVEGWVTGPSEAYPVALTGPVTVDPRLVGDRPVVLRMTFDQPIVAVRRVESTTGSATLVGYSPGDTSLVVETDGVANDGYATITVVDAVGVNGTSAFTDAAIGVYPGDFAPNPGILDLDDLEAFIAAYLGDERRADMDLSGSVDLSDVDAFIVSFLSPEPPVLRAPRITPIDDVFAPSGGIGRPVLFSIRDDRAAEDAIEVTVLSSDQSVVSEEDITLYREGGNLALVVNGPAEANGQTTLTIIATRGTLSSQRRISVTVRPDEAPIPKFKIDPFLGEAPLPVTFDARTTFDELRNVALYAWDFGDGTAAVGPVVEHTYSTPGSYNVTLSTVDDSGLAGQFTRVVTVAAPGFDAAAAPIDRYAAKRFLWQAAFGPTEDDIAFIRIHGYEAWIDEQLFSVPPTLYDPEVFALAETLGYGGDAPDQYFDDISIEGDDQLRQRIAWALIQIIVMNFTDNASPGSSDSAFYSEYLRTATGNYRDLLEYVTYSLQMGSYLTYSNSTKADPATGSVPDENYAREIKQLFTVGLNRLDERGKPIVDAFGEPIPVYGNAQITEFARVFTGLRRVSGDASAPMTPRVSDHDFGAKTLLNYAGAIPTDGLLPASDESAAAVYTEIGLTLDNLFYHPNVPPFIAELLIKRFVTSNPTGDYIRRVAEAFDGRGPYGSGQRGDIAPTIKALLLDPEARNPAYAEHPAFGKAIEPIIIAFGLLRATDRVMKPERPFPMNRIHVNRNTALANYGQAFMGSPSVFNFYLPDFAPIESTIDRAGLTSPELQVHTAITAFNAPNTTMSHLFGDSGYDQLILDLAGNDDEAAIDFMVNQWWHRPISPELKALLLRLMGDIDSSHFSIRAAARLLISSPEFVVLR